MRRLKAGIVAFLVLAVVLQGVAAAGIAPIPKKGDERLEPIKLPEMPQKVVKVEKKSHKVVRAEKVSKAEQPNEETTDDGNNTITWPKVERRNTTPKMLGNVTVIHLTITLQPINPPAPKLPEPSEEIVYNIHEVPIRIVLGEWEKR